MVNITGIIIFTGSDLKDKGVFFESESDNFIFPLKGFSMYPSLTLNYNNKQERTIDQKSIKISNIKITGSPGAFQWFEYFLKHVV